MPQETQHRKDSITQIVLLMLVVVLMLGVYLIQVRWLTLILLLAAICAVFWSVRIEIRKRQISWEFWCYALYAFGIIICAITFFPPPELEQSQAKTETLLFGLALLFIGAFMHAVLIYRGRAGKESAKKWALILCALVPGSIVFAYLQSKGSGWLVFRFVTYAILATIVLVVIFAIVFVKMNRQRPVNRMAQLIGKQKYREAIELAESLPPDARRPEVQYNLAIAYKLSGQNDKSRELFEQLQGRADVPEFIAQAVKMRLAELAAPEQVQ